MSKVVLHIGTHKTATTTIQDVFWANADLLAQHGLIYPVFSRHYSGHHGLVFGNKRLPKIYTLPEGGEMALLELAKTYGDQDVTVFLSSEEFSRADPTGATDYRELAGYLSGFDEIEVICVLRQQWQFLQSIYLEMSKTRQAPRPPQFVGPVIEKGMCDGLWVDYNHLLDQLETAFAPEQITFLEFDACRSGPGGVIGAMLRHVGVALDADDLEMVEGGASNVSPLSLARWGANILAEPHVAPDWLVEKATEALRLQYGQKVKPCLFTREEFHRLATHFDARNAALMERRAEVQPDFVMPDTTDEGLTLFRNGISTEYWVRFARRMVIERMQKSKGK